MTKWQESVEGATEKTREDVDSQNQRFLMNCLSGDILSHSDGVDLGFRTHPVQRAEMKFGQFLDLPGALHLGIVP